jgi:hypothetical protein
MIPSRQVFLARLFYCCPSEVRPQDRIQASRLQKPPYHLFPLFLSQGGAIFVPAAQDRCFSAKGGVEAVRQSNLGHRREVKMIRKLLGAVLAIGMTTAAHAVPIYDGILTFTNPAANNCGVPGTAFQAIYRPQINPADPNSGLIIFQYRGGVGFQRATDGQFSGAGAFAGVRLLPTAAVIETQGTFTLTQAPATAIASTPRITLTGRFTPTVGCVYVFTASFIKRPGT